MATYDPDISLSNFFLWKIPQRIHALLYIAETHQSVILKNVKISLHCILAGMAETSFTSLWDDTLKNDFFHHKDTVHSAAVEKYWCSLFFSCFPPTHIFMPGVDFQTRKIMTFLGAARISCHCTGIMEEMTLFLLCNISVYFTQIQKSKYNSHYYGQVDKKKANFPPC